MEKEEDLPAFFYWGLRDFAVAPFQIPGHSAAKWPDLRFTNPTIDRPIYSFKQYLRTLGMARHPSFMGRLAILAV